MTNVPEYRGTARKFGGGDLLMQLGRLKKDKVSFADWITTNTYLKGKPFSFAGHEYQKEIANDTHPLQAIRKCVQIGISEILIRKFIAFFILNDGRQGIYTFPTREGVRQFVKTRVNPTIQETPMLRSLDQDVDSVDIKQFGKSFLHFKGTFGERESIAVPSDFNCYERGTEILTTQGWKKIELLDFKDIIATRNDLGYVEWHKPSALIKIPFSGKLLSFQHRSFDLRVTANHHMLVKSCHVKKNSNVKNNYEFKEAKNLISAPKFSMTVGAVWSCEKKEFFEIKEKIIKRMRGSCLLPPKEFEYKGKYSYLTFCKFLGWYLAEGSVCKHKGKLTGQVCITHERRLRDVKDIRKTLTELGVKYSELKYKKNTTTFVFTDWALVIWLNKLGYSYEKYIPNEFLSTSYGLEDLLIRLYWGDASFHIKGRERYGILNTTSEKLADTVQIAWLKLGIRATIRPHNYKDGRIKVLHRWVKARRIYRVAPIKYNFLYFNSYKNGIFRGKRKGGMIREVFYDGYVYCLTVKNHIVMVRDPRNKTPIWCGQCMDEIDVSKLDAANMFRERMEHSDIAWEINCSKPTIPHFGISELYEQSDQKKFFIKCQKCNHWQSLFYFPEEGVKSNIITDKNRQSAHYVCIKCLREINYDPNIQMQWVAKFPERTKNNTGIRGYAINQLTGWAWKTALSVVTGITRYKKISNYYNAVLGLGYADPTRKLTRSIIVDCVQEYSEQSGGRNCFMAADQGKPAWAIIVQYDEEKDIAKIIHFEKVDGDMFDSVGAGGKVKKGRFSELMELYDILVAVIDAQPNSETANNMAKKYPGRVFPCYYAGKQKEQLKWTVPPDGDYKVTAHRTETMDTAMGFWKDRKVMVYPQDSKNYEIYEIFIEHLTGIVKVIDENDEGKRIIVWKDLKGGRESHFAHVWNYLCMAIRADVNLIERVMPLHLTGLGTA